VACIYNAVGSADWFHILAHTSGYRKRSGLEMNQVAYLIYLHYLLTPRPKCDPISMGEWCWK